jgi:hypothetical protein
MKVRGGEGEVDEFSVLRLKVGIYRDILGRGGGGGIFFYG